MINHSNRLKTVSIGIPAYNEEKTIKSLLQTLLRQKEEGYVLKEIIVMCDGSTDTTVTKARELHDTRIVVVSDTQRLGKSARLNQILQQFSGDILFLMDADITVTDDRIFSKILKSIEFSKTGLVGVSATPLQGRTFFEKVVNCGVASMYDIAKHWNAGSNYLSFKGCFLGLDRRLAKSAKMDASLVNNDAYFYFMSLELGYSPKKLDQAVVYYRSPATFADHLKQASRYRSSREELQQYFSADLTTAYKTPLQVYVFSTLRSLLRYPILLPAYLVVRSLTKLARDRQVNSTWEIAVSTKK